MSAFVNGLNNNLPRWAFILGNVAPEGGSNAGSDLEVLRYNDAGTYLGSPLSINRASGAMTVTGNIAVNHTTGVYIGAQGAVNTYLNLDTANYANLIRGTKGGTARWQISLGDGQTESGGNTGNNFALTYWNDAGTTSQSPITADRSGNIGINGSMYLANAPTAASQATTKSYVDTRVGAIRVLALIDANAGVGIALGVASTSDAGTGYGDVSYNFSFTSGTTNVPMISNYVNANPDQIAQVHIPQAAGCRYASYSPAVGYVDPTYYLIHAAGS
jgi:hypothetical protein